MDNTLTLMILFLRKLCWENGSISILSSPVMLLDISKQLNHVYSSFQPPNFLSFPSIPHIGVLRSGFMLCIVTSRDL